MQRRRNKSHKKAKQTGLNSDWEKFKELRKQATKALAKSYKDYVNNHIGDSLKTNPKRFWSFIKANKRENIGIPTLRVNDQPIINDRDKANALNNQFSFVFTQEKHPISQIAPSTYPNTPLLKIGIDGVIKQLENLNQNKATGPDELPARVLKETAKQIAPIITQIFQQSYNTGKLLNDWLQALVTPIHKKSHKSDPANYRPISLTCILCKVMEHIILSNMWKHLHKHNIILHFQHGFQSGLSCESWTTRPKLTQSCLNLPKPSTKCLTYIFYQNWPTESLQTLKIGSNLFYPTTNRESQLTVPSDITDVTSGVPQGSILGWEHQIFYIPFCRW